MFQKEQIIVVIDEIQRCPKLLSEIHSIMSDFSQVRFILTGSSARKLRHGGVNLLGGRAISLHLHPFTHIELGDSFSLNEALKFGTLPPVWLERNAAARKRLLKGYVETYLKEEIQQEALTRNVPAFAHFTELAGFENGNVLNYQNLSREIGIHSKTIKEYFHILEDTLIGFFLRSYTKSCRKKLVLHPKFYIFDTGVCSALQKTLGTELIPGTVPYGRAFEHWVIVETKRILDYRERDYSLYFFRTTDGSEVDLILECEGKTWAIEIKATAAPGSSSLRGLNAFLKDHECDRSVCVCLTPRPYKTGRIEITPWRSYFEAL